MTKTQASDLYERALVRAHAAGLKVLGRGSWKNGTAFYVVTSASELGRFHLVTAHAGRLACDCTAGQHGRMCSHRAIAHAELERERLAEAERRTRETAATLARVSASMDESERRETAMLTTGRADNKAFSIWKS